MQAPPRGGSGDAFEEDFIQPEEFRLSVDFGSSDKAIDYFKAQPARVQGASRLSEECGRMARVWDSPEPHPQRVLLTAAYTVSIVCLGLTMGAQGPAAISLAEQCGMIEVVASYPNGTEVLDTSKLDEMGVATGLDAIFGIFGCIIGAVLVQRYPAWHIMLVAGMLTQGDQGHPAPLA
jgi:hypothetical protein